MTHRILFAATLPVLAALTSCTQCGNPYTEQSKHYRTDESWQTHRQADRPEAPSSQSGETHYTDYTRDKTEQQPEQPTAADNSTEDAAADFSLVTPAPRHDIPEQILRRKAYISSFNSKTLMPNWVAWTLTEDHTQGKVKRGDMKFREDTEVDARYRVTTYDYNRSGYDRGHMCPAGDNKWDWEAMSQCFLMTNMCPQAHSLNAGDWNEMEMKCRTWARRYGSVHIVCGPIVLRKSTKRIGQHHKVTVPDAFFKVVLCLTGKPKAIGFIYRNRDGNRPMGDYMNTIDEVERITGFDFFPALPDKVEREVEAHASLDDWR